MSGDDFSLAKYKKTMILTGLLLLVLAWVFRYGSYLQQEYDNRW